MIYFVLAISLGPIFAMLSSWLKTAREQLLGTARKTYPKERPEIFGFADLEKLPLPENKACKAAKDRADKGDFEGAKQILVNAWLETEKENEPARIVLKEGFRALYESKGELNLAGLIGTLPLIVLENEVQWIVTHPDEQIGASGYLAGYEQNCAGENSSNPLE